MISAILFDLDNTLIDRDNAFRELIRAAFATNNAVEELLVELDESGYGDRLQLFRKWRELGGEALNSQQFGLAISRFVPRQPKFLEALEKMSNAFELAIVSNGSTATQIAKWRAAGLDAIIPENRLWISEAVGIKKPEPGIFRLVCQAMQVEPKNCLYVGDQPEIDIKGAQAAGLNAYLTASPLTAASLTELGESTRPSWHAA